MEFLKRLQPIQYRLLLASLLLLAVVSPLPTQSALASLIEIILLLIAVVTSIIAAQKYRRLFWVAVPLGLAAFSDKGFEYFDGNPEAYISTMILNGLFFALLGATFLYDIFRSDKVNADHISGAICVYIMVGLVWKYCYAVILAFDPEAIVFSNDEMAGSHLSGSLIYFSFVTLTTLGYGDIQPVSAVARTACWLEAVIGQLYMTILIAHLIGLNLTFRRFSPTNDPPSQQE